MKSFFRKLFGKKEKPDKSYIPKDFELEEREISPLLTPKDKSVPLEENVMDIVQPEEPIAPTLERQDDVLKIVVNDSESKISEVDWGKPITGNTVQMETNRYIEWKENKKKKSTKPKKQAKKKDNRNPDDDKSSWPKGNNFSL